MPRSTGHDTQLGLFGDEIAPRGAVRAAEVRDEDRRAAGRLPADLRLGTSSWSFPGWDGIVWGGRFSKEKLSREGLNAYARHPLLRTAGVDRTYYAPVEASVFADYASQVPDDFRFVVKAHEDCTVPRFPAMDRYGDRAGAANDFFLDAAYAADQVVSPFVEGLGARAGVLLFQFSPLDVDALGGAASFADRLHGFLAALPAGPAYGVEIRNASLFGRAYTDALRATGAIHCVNVHPSMPSVRLQRERAQPEDAPAVLVRWMLHSAFGYEQAKRRYEPFDRVVDEDLPAREEIADLCRASARAGRPTFVIANNKAEGSAPLTVFALARELAEG